MSAESRESAPYDLGPCARLEAESVGPLGQRFFRIKVGAERGTALLWLEKEQLYELGMTVKQLLRTEVREGELPALRGSPDAKADFEFKVGRIAMGHDRDSSRYLIVAHMTEDEERDEAVALWADPQQLDRLADQAFEVCAAGRPRCPLCGAAMDENEEHMCARTNGHSEQHASP